MLGPLYLLDGMALIYRAHFAFIRAPIFNSKGQNTSCLFGFANTLLDIRQNRQPTHLALALDTAEPTERHRAFAEYKAHREEIPEDIAFSIPHVERLAEAFRVPVLKYPGYEADDIIGTLAGRAEAAGWTTYMVTPDKDFAQLVSDRTRIFKPGRQNDPPEIIGVAEVRARWGVERPEQVIEVLGLMGDASDNIPGIPGFGEKTAMKLIARYGSIENLIAHVDELKGKEKERVQQHQAQALLSRRLATINRNVPVKESLDALAVQPADDDKLKSLFVEFEFNSLGRRLFGETFKAGRGFTPPAPAPAAERDLFGEEIAPAGGAASPPGPGPAAGSAPTELSLPLLQTAGSTPHQYRRVDSEAGRAELIRALAAQKSFCFDTETDSLDEKRAGLVGIAFSFAPHQGYFAALPRDQGEAERILAAFRPVLTDESIEKVGHNLKFDLGVLKWHGIDVRGPLFDTMIAHFLVEPDRRHGMDALSEQYLGYTPIPITALIGEKEKGQPSRSLWEVPPEQVAEYAAEDADVTWQLRDKLKPLLERVGQERVFYDIEMPLLRVLVDMEYEGVALDALALADFSAQLAATIARLDREIQDLAGVPFNLNSPKQLGEVLFDKLRLIDNARKTKTGQYATHEQVLQELAPRHPIVRKILEYRECTKLKNTYVDALPLAVFEKTGRVHTQFSQAGAITGRLASSDPNLQNIPIRTELGQEIRKAFVPRGPGYTLLSADYSQIELRIMAELSGDAAMREAFAAGQDIHAATAARIYGMALKDVSPEMRRTAKMVNFGIIYGISAFGLSQRLGVPRHEAAAIIDQYVRQYPGVKAFMEKTIAFGRTRGYVETLTGRRRYLRDINSANGTIRAAAERTAINSPIQGTAADMIKLAMSRIHAELERGGFKTRMLLQVHDELVFDLRELEAERVKPIIERCMKTAIPLTVPIVVDMGAGRNWLEAH
jgi:DNA polymerase-1